MLVLWLQKRAEQLPRKLDIRPRRSMYVGNGFGLSRAASITDRLLEGKCSCLHVCTLFRRSEAWSRRTDHQSTSTLKLKVDFVRISTSLCSSRHSSANNTGALKSDMQLCFDKAINLFPLISLTSIFMDNKTQPAGCLLQGRYLNCQYARQSLGQHKQNPGT